MSGLITLVGLDIVIIVAAAIVACILCDIYDPTNRRKK